MITLFDRIPGRFAAQEHASLRMSPGIGLGLYFFAIGLTTSKDKATKTRAIELARSLWGKLETDKLIGIGADRKWISVIKPWESLVVYIKSIREWIKMEYTNNPDISAEEQAFMSFVGLFLQTPDKEGYAKRMMVAVSKIGPAYAAMFSKAVHGKTNHDTGSVLQEQIRNLVKSVTGKDGTTLSSDKVQELKFGTSYDISNAKQYVRLRTEMRRQMLIDFTAYLDENGGKPVPVSEANEFLYDNGYDEKMFPDVKGTKLLVGVEGGKAVFFTSEGRRLVGNVPANATNIVFMNTYDRNTGTGGYISYRTPGAMGDTPSKLYTVEHKNQATEKKFTAAAKVADNITKYVARWKKDLNAADSDKFMSATAAILVYITGMRIGSTVEARSISGKASTGALTLRKSNVKISGSTLHVKYTGKKGVAQEHSIKLDGSIPVGFKAALESLLEDKASSDFVFSVEDTKKGRLIKLPYSVFTAYLKATGFPAGIHKIRHARGTSLMLEMLETKKFAFPSDATTLTKKQSFAEDFIKEQVLSPVAKLLGHKKASGEPLWSTSIQNYCNPKPLIDWFTTNGLRVPKWIPKKLEV